MKTHKWIIAAGAITLAGCDGGAEPSPAPAGGTAVAAKPGNSAASARKQAEWVAYNSQDGGFSVLLPATPEVTCATGKFVHNAHHLVQRWRHYLHADLLRPAATRDCA